MMMISLETSQFDGIWTVGKVNWAATALGLIYTFGSYIPCGEF